MPAWETVYYCGCKTVLCIINYTINSYKIKIIIDMSIILPIILK